MPVTGDELKRRLLMAARYGWSKPESGTPTGNALAGFLDTDADTYDPLFAQALAEARPDWLSGPGLSPAGLLYPWKQPF